MGKGEGRKKDVKKQKEKEHVNKYKDTGPVSPTVKKKSKKK